jgi:ABC-2 type transport system permease protein
MIRPIKAIVVRSLIKLSRDKMRLFFTLFMSGLFLFIFSFVTRSAVAGFSHPMNYLISGIIIMTVFQTSLNNSMNILEDIANGFMKEILVAPVKRWQIALGHIISSTIVSVFQGLIIIVAGLFMGLQFDWYHGTEMIILMCLVGLTFSSLGLYLASVTKESANFQFLVTLVTIPLTFLSGAYIPTIAIPKILNLIIYINPLTYTTAAFRSAAMHLENMPVSDLVKAGVAFNLHGFIITPFMSAVLVMIMGTLFFTFCVSRFNNADFSRVKIFKHGRR